MVVTLLFVSLILFLLLSIPIGVSLGLVSLTTIRTMDCISITTFVQSMIQGLNSFSPIAVPLFIFAGEVMGKSGISRRLISLARIFIDRFTGGLGIVAIVISLFFAAIAGTGSVTVAVIGLTTIPAMVKNGYDKGCSSALVTTAGTVGVTIPPSVCMVVYAVAASASVGGLFMAGIMPGPLIGAGLILYSVLCSERHGYKGEDKRYTPGEIRQIVLKAIPGLMIPATILGSIYGGVSAPTEAAAIAGVYGVIVGFFIYREIKPSDLTYIMHRSVLMCAPVLLIVDISTDSGRILTITQMPVMIADAILGLTSSKILVLFLINVLLLIMGTFMETNAAIIILTPIPLPIVTRLRVNPIRFGITVVMNLSIGFIIPPLGANLFMACQVGETSFSKLARKIWPWIVVMVALLMLVAYIPQTSIALSETMGVI